MDLSDEMVKRVDEGQKVSWFQLKKYLKIIGILCIVCIIVFVVCITIYASYLRKRSEHYTHNLQNYEGFFPTSRLDYYTESAGDFSLTVYSVFTVRHPKAQVNLKLYNVYWEEVNDYIDIELCVQENLQGECRYSIFFDSKPVRGKTLVDENSESVTYHTQHTYKNRGRFIVDDNMNPIPGDVSEYNFVYHNEELLEVTNPAYQDYVYRNEEALIRLKDFVYQNEEGLTRLVERANYYWDLGLAYQPD